MKASLSLIATLSISGSAIALPRQPRTRLSSLNSGRPFPNNNNNNNNTTTEGGAPLRGAGEGPVGAAHPEFIPHALPQNASFEALRYQPLLDYDVDSCYNVPAVDAEGKIAEGLRASHQSNTSGGCRGGELLDNQNVYVRGRCNNGWCAYMYEHYFEKDVGLEHVGGVASGHRHEWENVVVVVQKGARVPTFVAASAHDEYITRLPMLEPDKVSFRASHPKLVYHKNGPGTHAFRFATMDDEFLENDKHTWVLGALVEWDGFPSTEVRDQMVRAFVNTGAEPKISDAHFGKYLEKAIGYYLDMIDFKPYFDE